MKLSDFILLNEEQKKGMLIHEGILIAKRNVAESIVFLFQLPNYYVESYFNRQSGSIELFNAFTNLEPLNPYLEGIALEGLLN